MNISMHIQPMFLQCPFTLSICFIFQAVQSRLDIESKQVTDLKVAIDEYKTELEEIMSQLEQTRTEQKNIVNTKSSEVKRFEITLHRLQDDINIKETFIHDLEKRYNQSLEMLAQSQKHITELEETQAQYEDEVLLLKHSTAFDKTETQNEVLELKKCLSIL